MRAVDGVGRRRANRPEHVQRARRRRDHRGRGHRVRAAGARRAARRWSPVGTRPGPAKASPTRPTRRKASASATSCGCEPGGYEIRIVGQSSDTNLQASPTVFVRYDTWENAVRAVNPDARTPLPNALGVAPAAGVTPDQLVRRVDAVSTDLEALTRSRRRDQGARGRAGEQVVPRDLPPLRAGRPARDRALLPDRHPAEGAQPHPAARHRRPLVASWCVRSCCRCSSWSASGSPSARCSTCPLSFQRIGSIPLQFDALSVIGWGVGILVLGLASSWFSARRVLRLEPVEALSGGGTGS